MSGQLLLRVSRCNATLNLEELAKQIISKQYKGKPFANGKSGRVFEATSPTQRNNRYAIKLVDCCPSSNAQSDTSAHSELAVLLYLKERYIDNGLTPHLLRLEDFYCNPKIVAIASWKAKHHSIYSWVTSGASETSSYVWRVLLFQLAYTMSWIEHLDPGFRHNDLYSKNVLVYPDLNEGSTRYISPLGQTFVLPNVGFRVVIIDFGLSMLPGQIDNILALSFSLSDPDFGVGFEGGLSFDLYRVFREVLWLCSKKGFSNNLEQLIKEANEAWAEDMTLDPSFKEAPMIRPTRVWSNYPSCNEILHRSTMFRIYTRDENDTPNLSRSYGTRCEVPALSHQQMINMQAVIQIYSPTHDQLPEYMFSASRNMDYFFDLPSSRMFGGLFLAGGSETETSVESPYRETGYREEARKSLFEQLLYSEPCHGTVSAKRSRVEQIWTAVNEYLAPRYVQGQTLLMLCLYFAEAPLPTCTDPSRPFDNHCEKVRVYGHESVMLQYSWVKRRMRELGIWPEAVALPVTTD